MKSTFHRGRIGYACKDGKLYAFTKKHVLVMRGWPAPCAWVKRARSGWRHDRKFADELFSTSLFAASESVSPEPPDTSNEALEPYEEPDDPNDPAARDLALALKRWRIRLQWRKNLACARFFEGIPAAEREALLHYSRRKWHMLNLFARVPGSMELQENNPALAYALASNWAFHRPAVSQPMRAARSLITKKQRHILGWLGFPATEANCRIFRKIPPECVSMESLLYLRHTLNDPTRHKILCHLPVINAGVLQLINDRRAMAVLTPRVLEEVAVRDEDRILVTTYNTLTDLFYMNRQLGGDQMPSRFTSHARLMEVHQDLAERTNRAYTRGAIALPEHLPDPPLGGTTDIVPLRTPEEVVEEGRIMRHCVASYLHRVAAGNYFIYRVTHPVRATLGIERDQDQWVVDQIQGEKNSHVPQAVWDMLVDALFNRSDPLPGNPKHVGVSCDVHGDPVEHVPEELAGAVERVAAAFG